MPNSYTQIGQERLWTHARLLMLTATFDGKIVAANPAWTDILGWQLDEIVGSSFFDLLHPDDRDRTVAEAAGMMNEKQVPRFENRYRCRNGEFRDIDWTAVSDGRFIHAIGRDQTAEKKQAAALAVAEDALRQSQKLEAIGQLTGGVAHDFNNLLTVIKGSVELMRRPGLSEERRQRHVDAIGETADRAAKLTGQLLAFARRQALTPETFDIGQSITDIVSMLTTLTGSRITVETNGAMYPVYVSADRSQLDSAIVNLSVNARDAMEGEGRLTISTGPIAGIPAVRGHEPVAGEFVALTISDTGSGIPADQLALIFEPFYTTKSVGEGTGLGLSQVIGFAKQSGGDVRVESRLGQGTTFTLYLPRMFPHADDVAPIVEAEAIIDGDGVCVLIVEDNEDVGQFARNALKELGYDSMLAADAHEALLKLGEKSDAFHIVFSDVVMPGMSGIELGAHIRRLYPAVPVILTSGYSHVLAQNGKHGFELLHKPYSIEQLSRVLRKAIVWASRELALPPTGRAG